MDIGNKSLHRRWLRRALILSALVLGLVLPAGAAAAASLEAYRGAGVWVDIFDPVAWNNPEAAVRTMQLNGARTLYLQTSNSSRSYGIHRPPTTSRFIEAAHARGLRVVAWYLPTLVRPRRDEARATAAIRFRTSHGQRFDSFALDIESTDVRRVSLRNDRLLSLSSQLRKIAGTGYPLGAIIPSPRGMQLHTSFWPRFPYQPLNAVYDVIVPMVYSTYHVNGAVQAHRDTALAVELLRAHTGSALKPVHLIAGIADDLDAAESRAVIRAAREYGLLGASMYDMATMGPEDWRALRAMPANLPGDGWMPVLADRTSGYGNTPGHVAESHPAELAFRVQNATQPLTLRYEGYDIGPDEIHVLLEGRELAPLAPGPAGVWGTSQEYNLPAGSGTSGRPRTLLLVTGRTFAPWSSWGVRALSIS